ncbi:MAG: methylmalonyl-CoA mutase, partial [Thermotogota bacterium]
MAQNDDFEKIVEQKKDWEKNQVEKTTKRFPERKEEFKGTFDEEIKRLYTPNDTKDIDYLK